MIVVLLIKTIFTWWFLHWNSHWQCLIKILEENGSQLQNFHVFHYYFWSFVIAMQYLLHGKVHLKLSASLKLCAYDFCFRTRIMIISFWGFLICCGLMLAKKLKIGSIKYYFSYSGLNELSSFLIAIRNWYLCGNSEGFWQENQGYGVQERKI